MNQAILDPKVSLLTRAIIRDHKLKPPDAAHVATAILNHVDVLQTYDDNHLIPKDRQIHYKDVWDVPKWSWQRVLEPNQPEAVQPNHVLGTQNDQLPPDIAETIETKQVAAPAAKPDPTAQNVSKNEPSKASDLQSITASSLEPAQNLKQPSTKTNANQHQPDQTSEESNQSNPETDLTKAGVG